MALTRKLKCWLTAPALALVVVSVAITPSRASIFDMDRLAIDFTSEAGARGKANWGEGNALNVTANGLGREGDAASLVYGWIQTKPVAVGRSWRPPLSVSLQVVISPPPKPITLRSGQTTMPWWRKLFARFSPDCKHWSSWQALRSDPTNADLRVFCGELSIPQREREAYSALLTEYAKLDVPWKSDEEGAVRWIIERTPDFFERSIPFIGYVEFLYELPFYGGQRISRFEAAIGWSLSGLHHSPQNPDVLRDRAKTPWRFKAP